MGNHHDYIALDWVRGEIEDTLHQARQSLEAYVDNPDDTSKVRFCLNYIHQVHGTLQMVEFYGAALMAEEMEKLCQAMLNDEVSNKQEALEVLMQSILQLPGYLEHLNAGRKEVPLTLLPSLNDLRAARGEALMSDTSLFTPDLSPIRISPPQGVNQRLQDDKILLNLKKLRQMFQFSLASIIRKKEVENNFAFLHKVVSKLTKFCQGTAHFYLWNASLAFIEVLKESSTELTSSSKLLLRDIDHQLKRMIDENIDILSQPVPEDLLKHLLYYIAKSDHRSPQILQVYEDFKLGESLPLPSEGQDEESGLHTPNKDAIKSVVLALNEEIARVKDQLDLFVRSEFKENHELGEMLPEMRQVANTLAVLGLGIPRKVLLEQIAIIENLKNETSEIEDDILMDVAGALLYVEASLSGLSDTSHHLPGKSTSETTGDIPAQQINSAQEALLQEVRNGVEQVKNAIVNFMGSQWDRKEIEDLPSLFDSLRANLDIIPLSRAALLLKSCSQYVSQVLLQDKVIPDWGQLDILADAITSIEYYLERLSDGATENGPILKIAEESVAELGFPAGETPTYTPVLNDEVSLLSEAEKVELESLNNQTKAPISSSDKEIDEELLDDEIFEIFIEEANEVIETIDEFYPEYKRDQEDIHSLTEIRRAFHTLKGSGRLVGATVLGELAWSVENMLNRILDHSLFANPEIFELIDEVIKILPVLVKNFELHKPSQNTEELVSRAEVLGESRKSSTSSLESASSEIENGNEPEPIDSGVDANIQETEHLELVDRSERDSIPDEDDDDDDDDNLIDSEIIEIFIDEADEVMAAINEFLPLYLAQPENRGAISEIRRAFHTLKGSGRMVGAHIIAELAWSIENIFNRIIDGSLFLNNDISQTVQKVTEILPELIEDFKHHRNPAQDTEYWRLRAEALASGEIVQKISQSGNSGSPAEKLAPSETGKLELEQDAPFTLDADLLDIFKTETDYHLATLQEFCDSSDQENTLLFTDDVLRALHTLKGSANTANIKSVATIAIPLEKFVKECRARNIEIDADILAMLQNALALLTFCSEALAEKHFEELEATSDFIAQLDKLSSRVFSDTGIKAITAKTQTDPQLINIFLTEGIDILLDAENILNRWSQHTTDRDDLEKLIGELRTLHCGAQVASLHDISLLCQTLSDVYGSINTKHFQINDTFLDVVKAGHETLIGMMDQVAAGLSTQSEPELQDRLNALIAQNKKIEISSDENEDQELAGFEELNKSIDELGQELEANLPDIQPEEDKNTIEIPAPVIESALDPELLEIFLDEAREIISESSELLESWVQNPEDTSLLATMQRQLHTLKGGARMAEISAIGDLSHELETLLENINDQKLNAGSNLSGLLLRTHDSLAEMLEAVSELKPCQPNPNLIEEIKRYTSESSKADTSLIETKHHETSEEPLAKRDDELPTGVREQTEEPIPEENAESSRVPLSGIDPELMDIFLEEAKDIVESSSIDLLGWLDQLDNIDKVAQLQRSLHTLKGGARMAEIEALGDLAHEMENLFEKVIEGHFQIDSNIGELLLQCHDRIAAMVDTISEGYIPDPAELLIKKMQAYLNTEPLVDELTHEENSTPKADMPTDSKEVNEPFVYSASENELLGIFLDEAKDISNTIEESLAQWQDNPEAMNAVLELQRELHTLKGGARLADIDPIGDLAEAFYERLDKVLDKELSVIEDNSLALSLDALHILKKMLSSLEQTGTVQSAPKLIQQLFGNQPASDSDKAATQAESSEITEDLPESKKAQDSPEQPGTGNDILLTQAKSPAARKQKAVQRAPQQETVRVSASLIDELVNLAGETSITRGRLEQQVSNFSFTIEDMASTIDRLKEQLRRMEMETEAQILFGTEREAIGPDYHDFDPLEMDRYSTLQQLSRALSESSSDLTDLRETLAENVRDTETILLQQSRVNTELQEGLMKTRMIPFSSTVPRLRRIVRQISSELGKKVEFTIFNAEGEMDRTVLERMIAPLEHMLRNALDHGIETVEKRLAAGKSETGKVNLSLSREGGDILLRMQDDGAGVSIEAVRNKAISQALMPADAILSDNEILQFIMQPGFSTAQKVTQISGRGVGMDVVASEIKQLGGNISIDSKAGKGSIFTVRLPFTVSVNRALMVSTGEDYYAIPLNTIEGIVRVSTYELEEYYKPDAPLYEYAGQQYRLKYIGSLLNSEHQPKLHGQPLPLPVILVRGSDHPMALQVDSLLGSREIVVKSLGAQFSGVGGVSGATILGDGSVVVILDLPALIRTNLKAALETSQEEEASLTPSKTTELQKRPTLVMVIDDSVTVRKVTTRLLERNGMEVITAKDGVDAIAQLQDIKPDVMLLDIEMPRMDGFEVATLVRHDDRLQDVPICMITSRTGQKHRDRAISIGVNQYLGKPFQEKDLLDTIKELIRGS